MIFNKGSFLKNAVIFDDLLLQIIMGQWFGIFPSSSKKGFILSSYKDPKKAEDILEKKISKKKLEQVELEFGKLLGIFGIEDEISIMRNFNKEEKTFTCHLFHKKEDAQIQFFFHDIATFPSKFQVSYHDTETLYSFITDPYSKENILTLIDRKVSHSIREFSSLNSYKVDFSNHQSTIEIEYLHQLKSFDEVNSMIDTTQLVDSLKTINSSNLSILETTTLLNQCLRRSIKDYEKIQIQCIENIEGSEYPATLEILNGEISKLEIGKQKANKEKELEVMTTIKHSNSSLNNNQKSHSKR